MIRRALPLDRLRDLLTSERSLESGEVQERRQRYGANAVVEVAGRPWLDLARDTAKDPMIWFFAGVSVLLAGRGPSAPEAGGAGRQLAGYFE